MGLFYWSTLIEAGAFTEADWLNLSDFRYISSTPVFSEVFLLQEQFSAGRHLLQQASEPPQDDHANPHRLCGAAAAGGEHGGTVRCGVFFPPTL